MVLIIIMLVVVIICVVRKKSKKRHTIAFTGNTDVNMYASPAYGTHQVLTEPGLDHLYEPIDEYCEEEITTLTLQDTASPVDDDKIDADGYLKMTLIHLVKLLIKLPLMVMRIILGRIQRPVMSMFKQYMKIICLQIVMMKRMVMKMMINKRMRIYK